MHELVLDTSLLPEGNYTDAGYERRQFVDIEITRIVTEYQAQILKNDKGKKFVSPFPDGINSRIQYGNGLKAHAVYLWFMASAHVPFTNNQGENDLRMVKVQQKISGCFRSDKGAKMFFALRSYLSNCKKQNICSSTALSLLLSGHLPDVFGGAE